MEFAKILKFADLLGHLDQLVVTQGQNAKVRQVTDVGGKNFELVVAARDSDEGFKLKDVHERAHERITGAYLRYKARRVVMTKKFPGKLFSLRLLYERSNTSRTGNEPNPRGNVLNLFMPKFKILQVKNDSGKVCA